MYKEIVEKILSYPQRGQIKIDFDVRAQVFRLSIPIFSSPNTLPASVREYIEARKKSVFKPHVTSFSSKEKVVLLVQEIPFQLDVQSTLRHELDHFWKMSRHCHRMLSEMAIEEIYQKAFHLDSDLSE
jgi:hypothetical protein